MGRSKVEECGQNMGNTDQACTVAFEVGAKETRIFISTRWLDVSIFC